MSDSGAPQRFLARQRFAFVGVSRDASDFSRLLFRELLARGYDLVPVHPAATEIEGRACHRRVQDVRPPVDAALLMTPPDQTAPVVEDCAEAGVKVVWLHRGAGRGTVTPEALERCRARGIEAIAGECPYMFLPKAGALHRFHGFLHRLFARKAA